MGALTNEQLLLINNLIYTDQVANDKTVSEIISDIEYAINNGTFNPPCEMTADEWKDVVRYAKNDKDIMNYTVTQFVNDDTGMRAACFVDDVANPKDVNTVFRGTCGDYEWHDNGQGGYLTDTNQQIKAKEYIDNLPSSYGDNITVTGHSKGGNKAQYVTITTDRISRCISYDGQGFSQDFIDEYQDDINRKASRITSISAENDYVNCLLIPIAGKRIYIQTDSQDNPLHYHKPNILFDRSGSLGKEGTQSEFSKFINEYTTYLINEMDEPEKSFTIDGIIAFLEEGDDKEGGFQIILSTLNAGGHLDDFAFDYIGEHYGVGTELGLTFLASVACPMIFADDFINAIKETSEEVYQNIKNYVGNIYTKLVELDATIKDYADKFIHKAQNFVEFSRNWLQDKVNIVFDYWDNITSGWAGHNQGTRGSSSYKSSIIQVKPADLKTQANLVRRYRQSHIDYMNKLKHIIYNLNGSWKGEAQSAFVAKFQSMESVYSRFADVLEKYAALMDKTANEIQATDHNIKRMIQNV